LGEIYRDVPAPIFYTDPNTACMIKYASNAYHALKVVFANEIGLLSKKVGIDGTQVMKIFCEDKSLNISPRYLRPGFAFGGSCLPKDLRALLYVARHNDLQLPMLESILPSNHLMVQRAADLILSRQTRPTVGVVGLTFKPGTDDLRESPIVHLVETLIGKGLKVSIWDDNVSLSRLIGGNKAFIEQVLPHIAAMMHSSIEEVIEASDVIIVGHELQGEQERVIDLLRPGQLVVDLVKMGARNWDAAEYEGMCW
jgi:GDP-mannose 6-dehydrogenase